MISELPAKQRSPEDVSAAPPPRALPPVGHLARNACAAVAPFAALCLIAGKPSLALGLAVGLILSLAACGMLYVFVEYGVGRMVTGQKQETGMSGHGPQMILALAGKFVLLALIGGALLCVPHVNLLAVLVGFGVAQFAVVSSIVRHQPGRSRSEIE